jgi:hypothetical protein
MSASEFERPPSLTGLTPWLRELGAWLLAWANAHDQTHASPEACAISLQSATHGLQTDHRCPVCGDWQTEGGSVSIEDGLALQQVSCLNCNATWRDVYVLSGFDPLIIDHPAADGETPGGLDRADT